MSSCCQSCYRPKLYYSLIFSIIALVFILFLQKYFSFSVSSSSSLLAFFLFGLLAGFSTCSPLTTSLFISFLPRKRGALLFILSRLFSFIFFGYFLGIIGSFFHLSIQSIAISSLLVSLLTLLLSLNFLKIISLESSLPAKIAKLSAGPIIAGLLTFFLPCGFTLTVQSLAFSSASPLFSSKILLFFCLGTLTPLLFLFFSSKKIVQSQRFSAYLNQVIGLLLLFYSLYSLNSSFSLLNLPSISFAKNTAQEDSLSLLKMSASASGYSPNYFKVKAGQKLRWEVSNQGTSGCTNAIIAPSLFEGVFNLAPHIVSVKEFTAPTTPGRYRFTCWMGMISGTIEVVN